MKDSIQRTIARWIHILFGIPILGFIYGPTEEVIPYLPYFRYVFLPILLLTGLWMWKGHLVSRLFSRKAD